MVGTLCLAAGSAHAATFEQLVFEASQRAFVLTQRTRHAVDASSSRLQVATLDAPIAWQKVAGFEGTFTAEMPGVPVYVVVPKASSGGIPYKRHDYSVYVGQNAFFIQSTVYPSQWNTSNQRRFIQQGLDNQATKMDSGQWISVTWGQHQGLTSVEAVSLQKGQDLRMVFVLRGQQLFILTYIGAPGSARSDEVNRFFSSLNIR